MSNIPKLDVEATQQPNHTNNYMLPLDSPRSPRPNKTVEAVALILERIIQSNEKYLQNLQKPPQYKFPRLIQMFNYTDNIPVTFEKLRKFVYNFSYRTRLRNETLVGAIVYLDRLVQRSGIVISAENYLLVTAITLVACQKLYDDFHYSLKDYGAVFQLPVNLLIKAEHAFLKLIKYDLIVEPQEYNQYREYIVMKFEATLRVSAPFSPNESLQHKFELRGIASVKDISEFMLGTGIAQKQKGEDDDVAMQNDFASVVEAQARLPGAKFYE